MSERPDISAQIEAVVSCPEVMDVMAEFAGNMNFQLEGLPAYGLKKIVRHAALVAIANERGIPLDVFRMSRAETELVMASLAARVGVPVIHVAVPEKEQTP